MNLFTALVDALSVAPIDALAHFDEQYAVGANLDPKQVKEWGGLRDIYFGKTKFTRKQRHALERARGRSLHQLLYIERRVSRVADLALRWQLRLELLAVRGDFAALKRAAKRIVPTPEPAPPRKQLRVSASRMGMSTLFLTAEDRHIANMVFASRQDLDADKAESPQMADNFVEMFYEGGMQRAVPRPITVIPLDSTIRILGGQGDDTVLGLTDGTTMTGAQFLAQHFGDALEVALFHPQEGPVNLYRGQRLANQKQRDLVRMASTTCLVPGCRRPSDHCEIHHIEPWARGGETNVANLAPLCRYHNRVNDDDPARRKRGRIARIRGRPVWVSPNGYAVRNAHHPYGAMDVLFGR